MSPRTELEKAVEAAVERATGGLRAEIAALQAVDRRHSSTHGKQWSRSRHGVA